MCLKQLKEQVFRITSLSAHVISKNILQKLKFNSVLTRLFLRWLAENASQSPFETRQGKTKPVRMSRRDVYWEPHVEREREGEREREKKALLTRHDSVPETHFLLLPPQWVTLTGYFLCNVSPLCDWWVSFCQLMANPLLTAIRLPFLSVTLPDCDSF